MSRKAPPPKFTDAQPAMAGEADVVLVRMLVDDSGSVHGHEHKLINGTNAGIQEIIATDGSRGKYLMEISGLNGIFCRKLAAVCDDHMISANDYPSSQYGYGGTALYDSTLTMLKQQKADFDLLRAEGIRVRTASIVLTDGFDRHSSPGSLDELRPLANEMSDGLDHNLFGIGINVGATDPDLAQHVTRRSTANKYGLLGRIFGLDKQTPGDGSDNLGFPTEYHVAFQKLMGFDGPGAVIIEAENSADSIAAAMREASQSITRTGAAGRNVKQAF